MIKQFEQLVERYNSFDWVPPKQWYDQKKIEFVFHSNRLEGSSLTLIQTKDILESGSSNQGLSLVDGLMAVDHYKALNQALLFGGNKYPLTNKLLLEVHATLLKNTFEVDPFYISWKNKGQELGVFKASPNQILHQVGKNQELYPTCLPIECEARIAQALLNYEQSGLPFIEKLAELAQVIYSIHPFFDGNKRMVRLVIAKELVSEGLPLLLPHDHQNTFNEALVSGFIEKSYQPLLEVMLKAFVRQLTNEVDRMAGK